MCNCVCRRLPQMTVDRASPSRGVQYPQNPGAERILVETRPMHRSRSVRLWNAVKIDPFSTFCASGCMRRRVAAETAICEGLAMMPRLAPNQVARGGGQGLPAVAEPIRGMGPGAHAPSWSR